MVRDCDSQVVAEPGIAPGTLGNEPNEMLLLHPAISRLRAVTFGGGVTPLCKGAPVARSSTLHIYYLTNGAPESTVLYRTRNSAKDLGCCLPLGGVAGEHPTRHDHQEEREEEGEHAPACLELGRRSTGISDELG
jgi:hypothetical protein